MFADLSVSLNASPREHIASLASGADEAVCDDEDEEVWDGSEGFQGGFLKL